MAIYAISDLHLALSVDKPMDVFGARWTDYMERLKEAWNKQVKPEDVVIIPGDVSWATYIDEALEDFSFIDRLPGTKIISKGNHDYWWTTKSKLEKFTQQNGFSTIEFMQNNSYCLDRWSGRGAVLSTAAPKEKTAFCRMQEGSGGIYCGRLVLCGTRGWKCPGDDDFSQEDDKIFRRELQRLELSLKSVEKSEGASIIAALHYPPFNTKGQPSEFIEIMKRYNVKVCIYGHLHGEGMRKAIEGRVSGIDFRLISADYLSFIPLLLNIDEF